MPSAIDSPRPTGADQAEIARGRPEAPGSASTLVLVPRRFFHDLPQYRLGQASASWAPHLRSYSRHGDVLLNSLAHDLAFIVTSHARTIRPELRWQLAFDDQRQPFYVTPGPDSPGFDLIDEVRNFLVQSLARPRGGRGAAV